jgi:hypothetical protein
MRFFMIEIPEESYVRRHVLGAFGFVLKRHNLSFARQKIAWWMDPLPDSIYNLKCWCPSYQGFCMFAWTN